jgi:hypothetical protein
LCGELHLIDIELADIRRIDGGQIVSPFADTGQAEPEAGGD